ncbi:hypothetical protein GCM10027020_07280 [Nocardioides salsibiostraticola]
MTSEPSTATRNEDLLRAAVHAYLDALHRTDVQLLDEVFHPAASLFDVDQGTVTVDPYSDWRDDVDARPDPASAGLERDDEILYVMWLSDHAATVAVRVRIFASEFLDHLSLVRDDDRFRIVAKVWHLTSTVDES